MEGSTVFHVKLLFWAFEPIKFLYFGMFYRGIHRNFACTIALYMICSSNINVGQILASGSRKQNKQGVYM